MSEINPCPNPKCRRESPPRIMGEAYFYVACNDPNDCRMEGPECATEEEAIAAWNSIRFMPDMPERMDPPGIPCVRTCTGPNGKFVELMSPAYDKFDPSSHVYIRGDNRLQKAWEILRAVERTLPPLPEGA